MQHRLGIWYAVLLLIAALASAQTTTPPQTDVLGAHDFGGGTGGVRGANSNACIYCHAPHHGSSIVPLWNQTLSTKQYSLYNQPGTASTVSQSSLLCLSCHDGSVAVGQSLAYGKIDVTGTVNSIGGTQLAGSHPFSIQPELRDVSTVVSTLKASNTTKDDAVKLIGNNIECSTCHDVHNQYKDRRSPRFLVRDNTNGQLCMACHDTAARAVGTRDNPLTKWPTSIHATSNAQVAPKAQLGGYSTVAEFACGSCHASHNAVTDGLVRTNPTRPSIADDSSQACFTCHDGSDKLTQPILNIVAEYQKPGAIYHPMADSTNSHSVTEPTVLDRNRHATCVDCHAPHAAQPTSTFTANGLLRASQTGMAGISAGGMEVKSAQYQYETCLRCHGTSVNKTSPSSFGYLPARALASGDPLDVSLQFARGARSAHPVMKDAVNVSRPSVLKNMWNLNFSAAGRAMGTRIFCTDCHNSDTNREFGGTGPNGPHGSKNDHILERTYVINRTLSGVPGTTIGNLNVNPILTASTASPYALCAKCHDLRLIFSGSSWSQHKRHVQNDGFSCSVCHSAHGVQQGTTGVSGLSLVSFDTNVVAPVNGVISWSGNNCTLTCHGHTH